MKVVISGGFILVSGLLHMSRVPTGERIMAAWRRAIELSLGDSDTAKLRSIAQSRTEPASRVERARILLAYREDPSFFAVGLLFQTRPIRPASHPRRIQAGAQGSPHGRRGLFQPRSRRSHLGLHARQGRMI